MQLRQFWGIFGEDEKEIRGVVLPGALVVSGVHARLSNIDEGGRWIESEEFTYMDKEVKRVKGESCGRILESWRKLRSKSPELFEEISVLSQPAAFFRLHHHPLEAG